MCRAARGASRSQARTALNILPHSVPSVDLLNVHKLLFCFKIRFCEMDKPKADVTARYSLLRYGIGGFGTGGTSQIADAQDGRGGVGMSSPFPCLDAEQLGSVAGLQVMQLPVKVSLLG